MSFAYRREMLAALLLGCAVPALAADAPPIGQAEMFACNSEIAAFHDKEVAYWTDVVNTSCRQDEPKESCGWSRVLRETIAQDDATWWLTGNDHCEASDYPCFGSMFYNGMSPSLRRKALQQDSAETPASIAKIARDNGGELDLWYWSQLAQNCVAKAWVKNHGFEELKEGELEGETGVAAADTTNKAGNDSSKDSLHAANCVEALARQDAQFDEMNRNAPKPGSDQGASGAKALYQMGMYITGERLKVLDDFCRGEPQYAMYPSTKTAFDTALAGCKALSSDGGETCKPLKLW
jgi:hypothetical protein